MNQQKFVKDKVHVYYWKDDINCATTSLKVISEYFSIEINNQVIDAAIGLHGAGKYGAQCGLVEGPLLFIGIYGKHKNLEKNRIIDICNNFAYAFEKNFKSLLCSDLRPNGFNEDVPLHLCECLSKDAINFTIDFCKRKFEV